jgi:hypothetical protein
MGRFKSILIASSAAVLLTSGAVAGQGIVPDRSTIVTISAPVSVPGVVLPAGQYLFRLADTQASRNVVQIFDKDRTKIFATLIAISAERNEPSGEAVITFRESPANQAPALRYWYYAGEKQGQEFAYPKSQAIAIARASGEAVMAMNTADTDSDAMQKAEMSRIDPKSAEVAAAETPAPADQSAPAAPAVEPQAPAAPVETPATPVEQPSTTPPAAQPQEPPDQAPATPPVATPTEPQATGTAGREVMPAPTGTSGTASAPADAPSELPKTASNVPLVGLLGFLALGAAYGVRQYRRRLIV